VEGGRNGLPQFLGYLDGLPLQDEHFFQVDDIGPADSFFNHFHITIRVREPAGTDDGLEDGENEFFKGKIRLRAIRVRIGTGQDADIFSEFF